MVAAAAPSPGPRPAARLLDDVRRLRRATTSTRRRGAATRRPTAERDRHALAAAVERASRSTTTCVVVRTEVETWSVVPEARFDDLLAAAPALGRVVAQPRGRAAHDDRGALRSSWADETPVQAHDAPALSLRAYDDVVVTPRMIAHTHDLVLPQAFRNPMRPAPAPRP